MAFRCGANDDPTLNAGLVALSFLADPDQYCVENLYFCDFSVSGGPDPLTPSGSAHGIQCGCSVRSSDPPYP